RTASSAGRIGIARVGRSPKPTSSTSNSSILTSVGIWPPSDDHPVGFLTVANTLIHLLLKITCGALHWYQGRSPPYLLNNRCVQYPFCYQFPTMLLLKPVHCHGHR